LVEIRDWWRSGVGEIRVGDATALAALRFVLFKPDF